MSHQTSIIDYQPLLNYYETGTQHPKTLLLLHGLFGSVAHFEHVIEHFKPYYHIIVPTLPLYELPLAESTLLGLLDFLEFFIAHKNIEKPHIVGNSLGGHLALLYALKFPDKIHSLTLACSSGLYENALGNALPRRGDKEYIKQKLETSFYDPNHVTPELINYVYDIINNREKALRVISMVRSAVRRNLSNEIASLKHPTLIIWGKNDTITPIDAAYQFSELLPNAQLHIINECSHTPMLEKPEEFNNFLQNFLTQFNFS